MSGTFDELGQKRDKIKRQIQYHLKEHQRKDKSESLDQEREQRRQQTIETLNKAHDRIDQFLKSNSPRQVFAPAKPAFPPSLVVR